MADLTITVTGDEARAVRAFQKVIDKQSELARKAGEAGDVTRRSADMAALSLDKLATKIESGAKNLATWDTAVDALRGGFETVLAVVERIVQRQKEAAQFVGASAGGLEALGQLAGGDRARMAQLTQHVRRIYPSVGGADMSVAAQLVNDVVAAGFEDQTIDLAARLYGTLGGEAGKAATGIAGLQRSMGVAETGGFELVLAKAVEAARTAPGGVPEIAKYASKSGGVARAVGSSDEELFAAFSAVAAAAGNPEMGGSQLSNLYTAMAKNGGMGSLMTWVDQVGAKKLSNRDLIKLLGSDEAFRAFNALQLAGPEVRASTARMGGLSPVDLHAAGDVDPVIRAERFARGAEARERLSGERMGQVHRTARGLLAQDVAESRALGFPEWMIQLQQWAGEQEIEPTYDGIGSKLYHGAQGLRRFAEQEVRGYFHGADLPKTSLTDRAVELLDKQTQIMQGEQGRAPNGNVIPGSDR